MIHEDELIAELTELLEELDTDGSLELATRRGAGAIAGPLSIVLEERPDVDLAEWLIEREEVVELFIDGPALARRLEPTLHRLREGDGAPKWNAELARAIYANPDDVDARLVFGDWLEQEGDPRGELVAVQAQPADEEAARRREASLLRRFRTRFYGDLPPDDPHVRLIFRYGYIDDAELDGEHVASLFATHSSRFLRRLVVPRGVALAGEALARAPLPPSLVELRVGERTRARESGAFRIGFAEAKLQKLEVKCEKVAFEPVLYLPQLRELSINVQRLESLPTTIHLPELTALAFTCGYGWNGEGIVDFAAQLPKLRVVTLTSSRHTGNRLRELISSGLLSRLSVVDLRDGTLAPEDVDLLIENARSFAHLERLDLRGAWLREDLLAELTQALPNAAFGTNADRVREEDDEDEDDEGGEGDDEGWDDPPPINEDAPPEDEDEPLDEEREDEPRGVDLGAPAEELQPEDDVSDI